MSSPLTDKQQKILEQRVLEAAAENKLLCENAFAIATDLGVPTIEVGKAADRLKIKISNCQLGCF